MARRLARALGVELAFVSHPQDTALGQSMRDWIVNEIQPLDRERMLSALG
jgi:ABC-type Fe3+/spermidine/putrescine transport system ATPase subunit